MLTDHLRHMLLTILEWHF